MPHSVLQSNWYYGDVFGGDVVASQAYRDLAAHGYDQVPTAGNWSSPDSFALTVEYCAAHIPADKCPGYLQTVWRPTLPAWQQRHPDAIEQVSAVWPPPTR